MERYSILGVSAAHRWGDLITLESKYCQYLIGLQQATTDVVDHCTALARHE
jgi:hypothetical protein